MIFRRGNKAAEFGRRGAQGNATRRAHRRREFFVYLRERRTWTIAAVVGGSTALALAALAAVDYISQPDRFPVRSLRFEGEFVQVTPAALSAAALPHARGNFFLLELAGIRQQIAQMPWVRQVSVRRVWPDGVYVYVSEHRLVARWGARHWLNSHGEIVDLRTAATPSGLPLLDGPNGTQAQVWSAYIALNEIAKHSGLDIARLELSARRTWEAQLSNNLSILLGRGTPQPKLARFMAVYSETLAHRVEQIKQVDLRYTNGFSIQWVRAPSAGANEG